MVVLRSMRLPVKFLLGLALVSGARAETKHHWNPDITPAADGFFYVTWFNKTDANILLQKLSTSGVIQWTNSVQVNTNSLTYPAGWEPEPQIAVSGNNLYVVWGRGFYELQMMKLDTNGTRLWVSENKINSQPCETLGYDMAVDSGGNVYVHYQRHGSYGRASFLAKMDSNGNKVWTNDVASGQGSNQWDQRMAISASDAIYTINAYRVDVSTVSTYLQRLNTGGTTVWNNVDVGLADAGLTTDASGNVIVSGTVGTNRVYMKRYDPDGNQIGATAAVTSSARLPANSCVAVDGAGRIFVTWEDKRSNNGYDYEVYANRMDAAGTRYWSADRTANGIDLSEQQHSRIVPHPSGGIMAIWDQSVSGGWVNILANRVDAAGERSFASDVSLHEYGNADVDGDGMADAWELRYFDCSLDCSAGDDLDDDGVSNYSEYMADTVPTNVNSRFRLAASADSPNAISFNSSTSRTYCLEVATNLYPPVAWSDIGDPVPGDGGVMSLSVPSPDSSAYYRVKVDVR